MCSPISIYEHQMELFNFGAFIRCNKMEFDHRRIIVINDDTETSLPQKNGNEIIGEQNRNSSNWFEGKCVNSIQRKNVNHKIIYTFPTISFGLLKWPFSRDVIYECCTLNDQTILKSSLVRLVSGTLIRIKEVANVLFLVHSRRRLH